MADLLGELVAYPTESCSPNVDLIDHYADRARRVGAAVDVVSGEAGRANLHLRFGPDAPGGILLSGHTDVVPAGTGWATDPYALTEVGGRLAARGTADMKGFLAAALVLGAGLRLAALARAGWAQLGPARQARPGPARPGQARPGPASRPGPARPRPG